MALSASYYDGTNDYCLRGADLTGSADSKLWTGAVAIKSGDDTNGWYLFNNDYLRYRLQFIASGNEFRVRARNAAGTTLGQIDGVQPLNADGTWVHYMWSMDVSDSDKFHLYRNGVDDKTDVVQSDDLIDFTRGEHVVGGDKNGGNLFTGSVSMLVMWFGQYLDLSVLSNRTKLYNDGVVDLGADATSVGLGAPILYAPDGDPSTNSGTGGNYVVTGALGSVAGPPIAGELSAIKGTIISMATYDWDEKR